MKKMVNRMLALFLVLVMAATGLPQSVLTATAAQREQHTDAAKQQENIASEASKAAEGAEEYHLEIRSETNETAEEITENPSSAEQSSEEQTIEEESSEELSFTETESIAESSVVEETTSNQQETEKESPTLTEVETEEEKRLGEEVGIKRKGTGTNNPNVTWILYEDGRLVVEGTGNIGVPWVDCRYDIKTAEVNVNSMTSLAMLFQNCSNLQSVDFSGSDMSTVTDMSGIFDGCNSLSDFDVSVWDTSNVTDMSYMFRWTGLDTLDLSALNTSNVTRMDCMFQGCPNLTTLILNVQEDGWNTSNVTTMSWMFRDCQKLSDLQINGWDTSNLNYANCMFGYCYKLSNIDVEKWDTSNITHIYEMFYACHELTQLDLSKWDTHNVVNMNDMFYQCYKLANLNLTGWNTEKVETAERMFNYCYSITSLNLSSFNLKNLKGAQIYGKVNMFYDNTNLTRIYNPLYVEIEIPLPEETGHLWRREDGTAKKVFEYSLKEGESFLLTNDQMVGIDFIGKEFTLEDENGNELDMKPSLTVNEVTYGEKVVNIGSTDPFTFTVVPKEGYTFKSIKTAREDSTVVVEKGSKPNQYTITPKDPESGYTRDEQISVEIVEVQDCTLNIAYEDTDIADVLIVNGSAQTDGKPENIQISNGSETNLYIKVEDTGDIDMMEPMVYTLKNDGYNDYKEIISYQNTGELTDHEKELVSEGYFIFRLGKLYEDLSIHLKARYLLSDDDIASGESGDISWVIDRNGRLKVKGTGDKPSDNYYDCTPWSSADITKITSAVINWTGLTNAHELFSGHINMETVDFRNFDTSAITNMRNMFYRCESLKKIDLRGFNTENVEDMSQMFYQCKSLEEIDFGSFNIENVTDMGYMFQECVQLQNVELRGHNASKVTRMDNMFSGCEGLKKIVLQDLNTENLNNINSMFYGCKNLTNLDISGLDTGNVTDMGSLFMYCESLTSIKLESFNTENVENMNSMFYACRNLLTLDVSGFDTNRVTRMDGMFAYCETLKTLDISNFHKNNSASLSSMFNGCKSLTGITFGNLKMNYSYELAGMFSNCKSLVSIDLSSFDLSALQEEGTMVELFNGCTALEEIRSPQNVQVMIPLPSMEGSKWRLPDGTAVTQIPQNQRESVTLTTNRIAVTFAGDNFTIKDAEGRPMAAGQETLALKGTKDAMNFTIEPAEGYLLKSVVPSSQTPTISVEQGTVEGLYTVAPLDMDNGYLRDEELQVITVPIIYSQVRINYPYEGIADSIVVHEGTWARQMPGMVQVSSAGNTMLYVKMVQDNARTVQFPVVVIDTTDENGQWYNKSVPIQSDLSAMSEQEQELVRSGYTAFDLGYLYGNADVTVSINTVYDVEFELSGFPEEVQIIRYLPDENGVMRGEVYTGGMTAERGDTVYFQVKWKDTPEGTYRFCQTDISIPENTDTYLNTYHFSGVEGEVWGLTLYKDVVVQAALKPHRIAFSYVTSDVTDLRITGGNAQFSDDMRTLECYGGDTLSLSFGLAENITLKEIAADGAEFDTTQKDGICTVTIRDSAKIPQIEQITITTGDVLGRYALSDLDCKVEYAQSSVPYEGRPVLPEIRRVTVRLPDSQKETVLKENTDYTISCFDNIQVGEATLVITAAEHSQRYRGSVVVPFTISKAAAPAIEDTFIQLDVSSAGIVQQIDLSERCVIDTPFEKDINPTGYRLDLSDRECSLGGVLKGEPVLQGSTLTFRTWPDADKYSEPASLIVWVSFANYQDTRLKLCIQFAQKEELTLAGTVTVTDKTYDGMQVIPDPSGVYVAGKPTSESDKIMQELDGFLIYHYTGINGTEYDSNEAPAETGTYQVSVAISAEHLDYSAGYILAGSFVITRRPLWIEAESLTLFINDSAPTKYYYRTESDTETNSAPSGLAEGDSIRSEPLVSCNTLNMAQPGEYPITIDVSQIHIYNQRNQEVTRNYSFDIKEGKLTVIYPKAGSYTVVYSLTGHGDNIIRSGMEAGSLLTRPMNPTADGYVFLGWYKDEKLAQLWDFDTDIIQENITLYAGWAAGVTENKGVTLCIQQITDQVYTGKALKPTVTVYSGDGVTLLKAGKDYSVSYVNNIDADTSAKKFGSQTVPEGGLGVRKDRTIDTSEGFEEKLAYAVVTGKGNYAGTVCMNFHINPASIGNGDGAAGFTLKYTDQFEEKTGKNAKIVSSLKYQKTLKSGTDYLLSVQNTEGKEISLTPKGELPLQTGNYLLTITGQGNFTGYIVKKLYVSSKDKLMKNAKITYAKTIKDASREQLQQGITQSDLRISIGGSTLSENDFEVSYTDNHTIGTAAMTIHGKNGYVGTKRITFKIKGIAFKEKEFAPIQLEDLTYNGTALTQNDVLLKPVNSAEALTYGTDYIIGYKNNIKKGKASVIFTAKPSSGYSGSFKKTFSIKPLSLETGDIVKHGIDAEGSRLILTESVPYRKGGAMPSDRLSLRIADTGAVLKAGKDYTAKYYNNTEISDGKAYMVLSGKGNFTGSITIYYNIANASLFQLYQEGGITVTTTAARFTSKMVYDAEMEDYYDKYEDKEYTPAVTVKDGKKTLKAGEDYEISYYNCTQSDVEDWQSAAPYVEIQGIGSYGGTDGRDAGDVITKPISIYQKKLSANTLYIVYGEETGYTYTGQQITPEITVYYGNAADIKKAKRAKETSEDILTTPKPDKEDFEPGEQIPYEYGLTKLYAADGKNGGNYLLEYGENIAQGKNGTIKLKGVGGCTGNVTVKFTIGKKPIYYDEEDA